jgi:hypothetical protein
MADKQAVEQLKTSARRLSLEWGLAGIDIPVDRKPLFCSTIRDFLTKSALSRQRRFRVAN